MRETRLSGDYGRSIEGKTEDVCDKLIQARNDDQRVFFFIICTRNMKTMANDAFHRRYAFLPSVRPITSSPTINYQAKLARVPRTFALRAAIFNLGTFPIFAGDITPYAAMKKIKAFLRSNSGRSTGNVVQS